MHGFLIAGTNSGCGKTTVTIGLMDLLKSRGWKIAPFKTGPDYIDPLFHSKVLEVPSYNLDGFMLSHHVVRHLFDKHTRSKDMAIVEGVMGMYDGKGHQAKGSSYELSTILDMPVILVVSCNSLYQSVAAIVKGFASLREDARIQGIILNHVPDEAYYRFLKSVIEHETRIPCVGYVPKNKGFSLESRHLGLVQAEEVPELSAKIQKLSDTLSQTIDVEKLLEVTQIPNHSGASPALPALDLSDLHIGVAYDKAFRFYYRDNLELLEELGASLYYFSPIEDGHLPEQSNCLYLGGGYPEVFAGELSTNKKLLREIKSAVLEGMPVYAECGGLMYLSQNIIDIDGFSYPMAGVYNASIQMTKRLQRFGYATVHYNGAQTKCHEFHRSQITSSAEKPNYTLEYKLEKPEKQKEWQCGLKLNNCLAGYAHVHFYSSFHFLEQIVKLWKQANT
ncbi:MAG: cobyrinate a,c-diamide synthase [Bacteroidales bacterium]|nr:cobyrinate a,c-diamide synthase [Bacteroidales bacterium]